MSTILTCLVALLPIVVSAQSNEVLTQHNDNQRTGAYPAETVLKPANVRAATFGKLNFSMAAAGQIYAQPLYAQGVIRPDGTKNALFVATEQNHVYAFDAVSSAKLWETGPDKLGTPAPAPKNNQGNPCRDIRSNIGVTSTPAIDPSAGTGRLIYVVSKSGTTAKSSYRIFALNVNTGAVVRSAPIAAAPKLGFHAERQLNRPGLLLVNGVIYVAFGAHCDYEPYHGYVFAYRASDFKLLGSYCTTCATPQSQDGGIWQAGNGLAADDQGAVYFMTGNGTTGQNDSGDSFVKLVLQNGQLRPSSTHPVPNSKFLSDCDLDLGSSGPLLLPGNRIAGGGKEGTFYVLDIGSLAEQQRFQATFDQYEGPVQDPQGVCKTDGALASHVQSSRPHIHGSPVIWKNSNGDASRVFVWGEKDFLRAYTYRTGAASFDQPPPQAQPPDISQEKLQNGSMPGGSLSISSNANQDAILWAVHPIHSCADRTSPADANQGPQPAVLMAYDANNLQNVLWDSCMNAARDDFGPIAKGAKFVPPTIAQGRVYVATWDVPDATKDVVQGRILVYGLIP